MRNTEDKYAIKKQEEKLYFYSKEKPSHGIFFHIQT